MSDTMCDVGWVELAADVVSNTPGRWPAERIAQQLIDAFRAVGCAFHTRISDGSVVQGLWPEERFVDRVGEIYQWSVHKAPSRHPILRYYLATGDGRVMQVGDVPASVAPPRLIAAWVERGREWGGVQSQLALPLLMGPCAHRAFVIGRPDAFTAQEMDLARRLRRLLGVLDRHVTAYSRWVDGARSVGGGIVADVKLTPRELAVLGLLAEGLTAASIGRRLMIAERTVHKHLEHSYAKLGVVDRLGAVLRAQRIGLL